MIADRTRRPGPPPVNPFLDEDARLIAYLETGVLAKRREEPAPYPRRARPFGPGILWSLLGR